MFALQSDSLMCLKQLLEIPFLLNVLNNQMKPFMWVNSSSLLNSGIV